MQKTKSKSQAEREDSSQPDRINRFKAELKNNADCLTARFHAGNDVLDLIAAKADFLDELLIKCWIFHLQGAAEQHAFVAAGGYGRRELHPYSDIDILVLTDEEPDDSVKRALEEFFRFLWDIGLKPGQSVRTVGECVDAASRDQTIMTNLMESRLVYGSKTLYQALRNRTMPDRMWAPRAFLEAKIAEQDARYAKYNDTAYNLEPNIKEGPGGLRDIQMIAWVVKRQYNSKTLHELVADGVVTGSEYDELMAAQKYLWKLRFALHILTGRCEDRLLFDYQKTLAEQFGFQGAGENGIVEKFMQEYYRTVKGLERLNELLLQLTREVLLGEIDTTRITSINPRFQSVNGYLEVVNDDTFQKHPLALLETFLVLQQHPHLKGIRAWTIRLIRQNLHLIDEDFRDDRNACALFLEILRQPIGITHQLRRMNRYGVLAAYLPAFGHIVGRMQYDLFHVYTVDEHTLFLVRNLRRFALSKFYREFPFCNDIFKLIAKPELLYIAGLFHDIAKGKGGDHSTAGEKIAEQFCIRHGLPQSDTKLIKWLVRRHLIMSMTSQRKDISDPEVIREFAETVGSKEYLDYLYLLTVADIRATNPDMWNSWKDSLLKELYTTTVATFLRDSVDQQERLETTRKQTLAQLVSLGIQRDKIDQIWGTLDDEYFLRFTTNECVWHTLAITANREQNLPISLFCPRGQHGSAEVFLYDKNTDFLFSRSTAILDQLGLNILDARIITTSHGYVLKSYLVLEQSGEPIRDLFRQHQICTVLRERLLNPGDNSLDVTRRQSRQTIHFPVKTQIIYGEDPNKRYTILELITTDRPGLLSKIGQAFDKHNIRLYNAKISTIGSRAEDIFYIKDNKDKPITDENLKESLKLAILELVDER